MAGTYDPELYDLVIGEDFGGDLAWYRDRALARKRAALPAAATATCAPSTWPSASRS
jgi:hypothetical protein